MSPQRLTDLISKAGQKYALYVASTTAPPANASSPGQQQRRRQGANLRSPAGPCMGRTHQGACGLAPRTAIRKMKPATSQNMYVFFTTPPEQRATISLSLEEHRQTAPSTMCRIVENQCSRHHPMRRVVHTDPSGGFSSLPEHLKAFVVSRFPKAVNNILLRYHAPFSAGRLGSEDGPCARWRAGHEKVNSPDQKGHTAGLQTIPQNIKFEQVPVQR